MYLIKPINPNDIKTILLKGALTDTNLETFFAFSIFVFNEPPYFELPLRDQRVWLRNELTYVLPSIADKEMQTFKLTVEKIGEPMPSFIKVNPTNLTFNPKSNKELGSHILRLKLDDSYSPPASYFLKIIVEDPANSKLFKNGNFSGISNDIPEIVQAQLRIQQITRDGKLILSVKASRETELITKLLRWSDLEILVKTKKEFKIVNGSILNKDIKMNTITLELKYANSSKISKGTVQDILHVKVISDV